MATVSVPRRPAKSKQSAPLLKAGDRLDQKTFHARYEACPPGFKAELIGGIVHVPSPMQHPHSWYSIHIDHWLIHYESATPGVEALRDPTSILGPASEPQPDACLRILEEDGGRSISNEARYIDGPPELVVQVSDSTLSRDLNERKRDCEDAGVLEYLVVAIRKQQLFWFVRHRKKLKELAAGPDGIWRSRAFPGLWLDASALFARDMKRVSAVLQLGLVSPEHTAFVAKLAKRST